MKPKKFIALTSVIHNKQLVLLQTSAGFSLHQKQGITPIDAVKFLFSLYEKFKHHNKKEIVIFINYAFTIDNEFLFAPLSNDEKDRLFGSRKITKILRELEHEKQDIFIKLFTSNDKDERQQAEFEKEVNYLAEKELKEVKIKDYKIQLINGKSLTITKNKHSISFYDIYGFFRQPLYSAVKEWLNKDITLLDSKRYKPETLEEKHEFTLLECQTIQELAEKLNEELKEVDINLTHFHGTGAIASYFLSKKLQARKEYKNFKYVNLISRELDKAGKQAFYGGRAEQFKIGTINKVNVYDINSAYAYASSFLPVMNKKPRYYKEWQPAKFSVWFLDYDFRQHAHYLGLLPNRDFGRSWTLYKQKGKGYFWQPEVAFMLKNFPECVSVKGGYVWNYRQAEFAKGIEILYRLRLELKDKKHPLADIIKLALSSVYGKFCQHQGRGYYYNLFYAGYITSIVRTLLLQAVKGYEQETVCFLTDAIHTTTKLNVPVSDELGAYKLKEYEQGRYIDNGIYQLIDKDGKKKTAKKGFRELDFDLAFSQLADKRIYSALMEFFTGYNLHSFLPVRYQKYLEADSMNKKSNPFDTMMRLFDATAVNLKETFTESKALSFASKHESSIYRESDYKDADFGFDSIRANKI